MMSSFKTTGRLVTCAALLILGSGLAATSWSQGQDDDAGERTDSEPLTTSADPLEEPLAALHYGRIAANADAAGIETLIGKGTDKVWACASCHGDQGQGAETVPRLAGLPAGYLTKQLHDYANQRRLNANMQYVVEGLTGEQMAALGKYYAQLESPSSAKPSLSGDLDRGRELVLRGDWSIDVPACYSCHGSSGWGVGQAFPALAAQHPSYTYIQLASWKNGRRANSPVNLMHNVATALSENDMRSVADYLASLPAPPAQKIGLDTPPPEALSTSTDTADRSQDRQQGSDEHD
ncbi:c-type cytochrome [Halomonas sp. KAO]|nr:c-type cytochrome [Halomonas sp. KAO]